jgi:hypothetical protein
MSVKQEGDCTLVMRREEATGEEHPWNLGPFATVRSSEFRRAVSIPPAIDRHASADSNGNLSFAELKLW